MKKLIFTTVLVTQLAIPLLAQLSTLDGLTASNYKTPAGRSELKINAVRDLIKRFGDVDNASWSSNKDRVRASFSRGYTKYMVDYDQKGKWVSTILVYDEAQMSRDLRKVVKSNHIDYIIVKVIEVKIGKSHVHFVKLENATSLLTLHIMNGDITEIENYVRG